MRTILVVLRLSGQSGRRHANLFKIFCILFTTFVLLQYYINHPTLIQNTKGCHDCGLTSLSLLYSSNFSTLKRNIGVHQYFSLTDDGKTYFTKTRGELCFQFGGFPDISGTCVCKPGWWGKHCSYPRAIQKDVDIPWHNIKPRGAPRRVINAVTFNNEFDMTEIRLHELGDVVDLFMFGESNYSSYGDPKPQRLLNALNNGFMSEYQHKILYVFLDHFDPEGISNGWISEALQRNNIGEQGLKKQLSGTKPDDIFILSDADEIPKKEAIMFLKNHNGYPEPFGFTFQQQAYTFYWMKEAHGKFMAGCTMNMVRHVLEYKVYGLRSKKFFQPNSVKLRSYSRSVQTTIVRVWYLGDGREPTAWHCSSCTTPKGIKQKMMAAQNGDFPRWGDYPEKMNETYIRTLIISGLYFDEKTRFVASPTDRAHVPEYVIENYQRFAYLLDKSYYGKPELSLLKKPTPSRHHVISNQRRANPNTKVRNRDKPINPDMKTINDIRKYLGSRNLDKEMTVELIMGMLRRLPSTGMNQAAKIQQISKLLIDLKI